MNTQATAVTAFDVGNYTAAYKRAETPEMLGAALIMLGDFHAGMQNLKSPTSGREWFALALAHWYNDSKSQALHALLQISPEDPYYRASLELQAIIDRGFINVLIQGREDPLHPIYDFVGNLKKSPFLQVKSLGISQSSDVYCNVNTHIDSIYQQLKEWQPDLFFNAAIEDHSPPLGLEKLTIPKICHTQDFDRHFSQCIHYFKFFDAAIALGEVDHPTFSRLTEGNTFVFPFLFGVLQGNNASVQKKDIDFFVSGSNFNNTDGKAKIIWQLITKLSQQYKVVFHDNKFHDGYLTAPAYNELLSRAKCTLGYVNRWGLINSRNIEALRYGCCALYQAEGELSIFFKEDEGAIPYQLDNVFEQTKKVIDSWENRYSEAALKGQQKVFELFEYTSCTRRLSVLLCAYTALIKSKKQITKNLDVKLSQVRFVNRSLWRIPYAYNDNEKWSIYFESILNTLMPHVDNIVFLEALGEYYLYRSIWNYRNPFEHKNYKFRQENTKEFLTQSILVYEKLNKLNPNDLIICFNLARLYFENSDFKKSVLLFQFILDCQDLTFYPERTVFWREFHDKFFAYDEYMQKIVELYLEKKKVESEIFNLVKDSALCYLLEMQCVHNFTVASDLPAYVQKYFSNNLILATLIFHVTQIRYLQNNDSDLTILNHFLSEKPWMILNFFDNQNKAFFKKQLPDFWEIYQNFKNVVDSSMIVVSKLKVNYVSRREKLKRSAKTLLKSILKKLIT